MKAILILYIALIVDYDDESKNLYLKHTKEMPSMESCWNRADEIGDLQFSMGDRELSVTADCILVK